MAEALIAISVILIGVISSFLMVFRSLYDVSIIQDRLTATFLVQEGIELIRQRRDSNFLSSGVSSWDYNLQPGTYRIGFSVDSQGKITGVIFDKNNLDAKLYQHQETGIFNYSNLGKQTPFIRTIELQKISDYELKVVSTVRWTTKKLQFEVSAEDHLFNWLNK